MKRQESIAISLWQWGKESNGMNLRGLSEEEEAYVVSVVG